MRKIASSWALFTALAWSQTQIDLAKQTRNVDFTEAISTRPVKTGTVLPMVCLTGELFFRTASTAGANLYACTAPNTWTLETGGGSTDQSTLGMVDTDSTTLTIGPDCMAATPCNVRFGNQVWSFTQDATVALTAGTGTAYFYVTPAGVLTVGHNLTLTCTSCVAQAGITAFPVDSIPLFIRTATAGQWNVPGADERAVLSTKNVAAGIGVISVNASGLTTLSVDRMLVPFQGAAPATSTTACVTGTWAFDTAFFYICVSTNTWRRVVTLTW